MGVVKDTKSTYALERLRFANAQHELFTEKQRIVLEKVLRASQLSIREQEMYSRIIKPRLNAIIDFYQVAVIARSKESV